MFSFVEPEAAVDERERLLAIEEEILQALEYPVPRGQHRGRRPRRLGGQEVRLRGVDPGQGRYREVTSTSNTTDFQARRLEVRYRPAGGGPRHVATLNGTAVTSAGT